MIEPRSTQERGLRPGHKLTVVAVAVIAVLVAYVALHAIVGLIALLVKNRARCRGHRGRCSTWCFATPARAGSDSNGAS